MKRRMVNTASFVTKLLAALALVSRIVLADDQGDDFYQCMPGAAESPGVSIPKGDTEVAVNSSDFDIFCHLNPDYTYYKDKGIRSNNLVFHLKNGNGTEMILESTIVNDTTIKATYHPNRVTRDLVDCYVKVDGQLKGLCNQIFYVGYEPLPPDNFTCISDNWQSLNCTWDVPYNPVKTTYTLHYVEPGHGDRSRNFKCNPYPGSATSNNCYLKHNPQYRKTWEKYLMYIKAENSLSPQPVYTKKILDHFQLVLPKPPIIETLISRKARSIDLRYSVEHNLHFFPPGLAQDVEYRSQYEDQWTKIESIDFIDTHVGDYEVNHTITGLHPYTLYSIRIRMRSNASSDPKLWSQYATQETQTLPDVPDKAPETTLGSFEIVSNDIQSRNVFVYWHQIDDALRNGPNFNYIITDVLQGNKLMPIIPQKVTKAYALFSQLRLSNYTFHVTSQNDNGTANSTSKIFVPHNDQIRGLQPRSFTKVAYTDTLFELSWLPPANEAPVVSYTVFWCLSENNRDRPYQCEGQLDWQTVEKQKHSLNVTLPNKNVYQFAVSANTGDVSSGMTWATCTIIHNRVVGKLKTVSVDVVEKTSMVVRWRLDCTDRVGIVSGYKVMYCPIQSYEDTADCIQPILVQETSEDEAVITNLDPWTIYKVAVSVMTKAGEGEPSDYLVNQTARAAPGGPPENIEKKLIASNVIELHWELPNKPNGPIALYEIRYGYTDNLKRYSEIETKSLQPSINLTNLAYYADYDVKIRACGRLPESIDVDCGDWGAIKITTGIGPSEPMLSPGVTFINSTEVEVVWNPFDFQHGGPIYRYDLEICSEHTQQCNTIDYDHQYNKVRLFLDSINDDLAPDCQNSSVTNMFSFRLRSVTQNKATNEIFESPWSPKEIVPAYCQRDVPFVMIGIVVAVVAVVSILLCLYFLRCYKWSLETNNIFKDIDKEMEMAYNKEAVAIKKPIESFNPNHLPSSSSAPPNSVDPKVDWTEMNDMSSPNSGKHPSYQRSGSKDSMQILLDSKEKTISATERGTSESTSGCESGQSDDLEVCAKSASQSPVSCSSENISKDHQIDNDWPHNMSDGTSFPQQPYSQISAAAGAHFWHQQQANELISNNEGYTRAAMMLPASATSSDSLENLRPPPNLSFVTRGPQDKAYVTLQRFEMHPQYQGSLEENDDEEMSNESITPVVSPPPSGPFSASTNSFHLGPTPADRKPVSNGYITVDEANKMLLRQNITDTSSDPRAYSKVAIAPISASSNENPSSSSSTLVMSAKDLQVETKPPFRKVVTTLDDGNSVTRSTMV